MKKQTFRKQMLQRQWDTERSFYKHTLPGPSLSTRLVHTIVIYGDSSLLGTGLLSTFLGTQVEGQSFFLRFLVFDHFHLGIICISDIFEGIKFFSPPYSFFNSCILTEIEIYVMIWHNIYFLGGFDLIFSLERRETLRCKITPSLLTLLLSNNSVLDWHA